MLLLLLLLLVMVVVVVVVVTLLRGWQTLVGQWEIDAELLLLDALVLLVLIGREATHVEAAAERGQ